MPILLNDANSCGAIKYSHIESCVCVCVCCFVEGQSRLFQFLLCIEFLELTFFFEVIFNCVAWMSVN